MPRSLLDKPAVAPGDVDRINPAIVESLLPDAWAKSHPEFIRNFCVDEKRQRAETRRFKRAERRRLHGYAEYDA